MIVPFLCYNVLCNISGMWKVRKKGKRKEICHWEGRILREMSIAKNRKSHAWNRCYRWVKELVFVGLVEYLCRQEGIFVGRM